MKDLLALRFALFWHHGVRILRERKRNKTKGGSQNDRA
jgi:hypothetical protein